jgi:hypothetical protein
MSQHNFIAFNSIGNSKFFHDHDADSISINILAKSPLLDEELIGPILARFVVC